MEKTERIDRGIYSCSAQIRKKYTNPKWALTVSVIGLALIFFYWYVPGVSEHVLLAEWILTLGVCGLLTAVTLLFFYLFGDCAKPFYIPTGQPMERTELYFDDAEAEKVKRLAEAGDFNAVSRVPRSYRPGYMLVIYRSSDRQLVCSQLIDCNGVSSHPVTPIGVFEKGHFTFSESLL